MIASVNFNVTSPVNVNVNPNPETPTPQALGDFDLTKKQPLTPQPSRQDKIDWLLTLGLSPLPVAPAQDSHTYPLKDKSGAVIFEKDGVTPKPKFSGKNPSYLDVNGKPHALSHKKYQNRQPTKKELDTWFANDCNGVGSLGSDEWVFVDLDRKNFDVPGIDSEEAQKLCDDAGKTIIEAIVAQTSKLPPYERTQSYGWRMVVGLSSPPSFTNFSMTPGGDHVGEILGKGRFAVLAPTLGPSGNHYEAYHRCAPEEIPIVDALEQLPFVSVKVNEGRPKKVTTPSLQTVQAPVDMLTQPSPVTSHATQLLEKYPQLKDKVFDLRDLGTDTTRDVLAGLDTKDDRSASITTAIRDWYGWERWCKANGIAYRGDTRSLALEAASKFDVDEDRVDRILAGIDGDSCLTSCEYKGNSDDGCWKRILKLAGVKGLTKSAKGFAKPRAELTPQEKATVRNLEIQFPNEDEPTSDEKPKRAKKPPSPKRVAEALAEEYRHRWKYWCEKRQWMEFNGKVWRVVDGEAFVAALYPLLKSKGIDWEFPVYVENVVKSLKNELLVTEWPMWDRKRYIAFSDKVLDNVTGQLLDFEPGMGFLSHLPYEHAELPSTNDDPIVALQTHCPKIFSFMNRAMGGSRKRILKLLAIINGAIKFRFFDLQFFVHLMGKPGTGKGTFARILAQIVGSDNSANSTIASLDEPTEMAALIDKQLITCADERKQHGIDTLLRLTGGDKVRYREIYKPRGEGFFYALLLILSNRPIFSGDVTGLKRRTCLVEFISPIPKALRDTKAEREQNEEIPSLIPIALMLSDDQVTSLIKGLGDDAIPEFKRQEWEMQIQVNPLAAWVNEWLIHDPKAELPVGDEAELRGEDFSRYFDPSTAYGSYLNHCRVTGVTRPLTRNTFSPTLVGLCQESLEWEDVTRKRNKRGVVFQGLRLRQDDDKDPWVEETFDAEGVHRCRPGVDPGVDPKPLPSKGGVDYVDLCENNEVEFDVDEVNAMLAKLRDEELYGVYVARLEQTFTQSAGDDTPSVNETSENDASTPPTPEETIEKLGKESTPSTPPLSGKGFGSTPGSTSGLHRCTLDATDADVGQSPALTSTAQNTTNKDATPNTVGKLFRYVGNLIHTLKDAEGNPILDAEGKPLTLTKGSELLLEDVGGVVNDEYVNVRPTAVDCRPLGLRRSQLEKMYP